MKVEITDEDKKALEQLAAQSSFTLPVKTVDGSLCVAVFELKFVGVLETGDDTSASSNTN